MRESSDPHGRPLRQLHDVGSCVIEKKEMTRALHNGRPTLMPPVRNALARALCLIARYDKIRKPIAGHPEDHSRDTRWIDWLNSQPRLLLYE